MAVKPVSREWLNLLPDIVSHFSFCLSAQWMGLRFQELAENFFSSLSWGRVNWCTPSFAWSLRLADEQCSVTTRYKTESVSFAFGRSAWDWDLLMQCLSNKCVCDWDRMNSFHLLDHQFASWRGDTELRSIAPLCIRWKEMGRSDPRNASAPPVLWPQS